MEKREFDVIFIGAGGSSYPGAFFLAERGKKVLMIDEKGNLGGDCLYAGCIPSKTVRYIINESIKCKQWGLIPDITKIWNLAVAKKDEVQKLRYDQHMKEIEEHYPDLVFFKAHGEFISNYEIYVKGEFDFIATAQNIVIATGAETVIPPIPNADKVLTSNDLFMYNGSIKVLPESIVIIGAGYIGLEVANMMALLGVKTKIIEMLPKPILGGMDDDLIAEAVNKLSSLGVEFLFNSKLKSIDKTENGYILSYIKGDKIEKLETKQVLIAVGRRPRLNNLGLENTEIKIENHAIWVDDYLQTNVPGIYAVGDVTGKAMLFHAAVKESLIVAKNIINKKPAYKINYDSIPFTVFTYPELGKVGLSEKECKDKNIKYQVLKYDLTKDAQSQILDEINGWIKIIYDPNNLKILGAEIYAHNASELITEFTVAIEKNLTMKDLAWICNPHPLSFESINYSLRGFF
ncbi:MAG: dihydrolipoyl dehydrogenase [Thermoplasmata archaeon]